MLQLRPFDTTTGSISTTDIDKLNKPDEKDVFYRYTAPNYAGIVTLYLSKYNIFKKTPKGFWITGAWDCDGDYKRWVSATARKRFAYPTKREALVGYQKRTQRYIKILEGNLSDAQQGESIATQLLKKENNEINKQL